MRLSPCFLRLGSSSDSVEDSVFQDSEDGTASTRDNCREPNPTNCRMRTLLRRQMVKMNCVASFQGRTKNKTDLFKIITQENLKRRLSVGSSIRSDSSPKRGSSSEVSTPESFREARTDIQRYHKYIVSPGESEQSAGKPNMWGRLKKSVNVGGDLKTTASMGDVVLKAMVGCLYWYVISNVAVLIIRVLASPSPSCLPMHSWTQWTRHSRWTLAKRHKKHSCQKKLQNIGILARDANGESQIWQVM